MKGFFKYIVFPLLAVAIVGCSDDDDYNADTAISPYEPVPERRLVSQVSTTDTIDGRAYLWEYNFSYDVHNRIKEINSKIVGYVDEEFVNITRYYKCNKTSKVNYYYLGNDFRIEYSASHEYPEYPAWNGSQSAKWYGVFNSNGTLAEYSTMDFEYNATQLKAVYLDGGNIYEIKRDTRGNVTGYVKLEQTNVGADRVVADYGNECRYSSFRNNTNFDFSGYFGFWGIEKSLPTEYIEYYAPYQLTAFGMLGATSAYLPLSMLSRNDKGEIVKDNDGNAVYLSGEWVRDEAGYPLEFVEETGRKTEIKYVD